MLRLKTLLCASAVAILACSGSPPLDQPAPPPKPPADLLPPKDAPAQTTPVAAPATPADPVAPSAGEEAALEQTPDIPAEAETETETEPQAVPAEAPTAP